MSVVFKPAGVADLEVLVQLMGEFNTEAGYPSESARIRQLLAVFLSNDQLGDAWLIQFEEGPVGYLVLTFCFSFEHGGREAFIDELYVAPAHRKRGFGQAALSFAQRYCSEHSLHALHLEVEHGNAAASHLYAKSGFQSGKRSLMNWQPPTAT